MSKDMERVIFETYSNGVNEENELIKLIEGIQYRLQLVDMMYGKESDVYKAFVIVLNELNEQFKELNDGLNMMEKEM